MVKFENKQFVIVIPGDDTTETWLGIYNELLDLLYCQDEDFVQQHKNTILLLQNMMPSLEQAEAIYGIKPKQ